MKLPAMAIAVLEEANMNHLDQQNRKDLIEYVKREALKQASLIVAIDGRCASGKSTLANELANALDANLFHMDDFFLRPEQRTGERLAKPGENIDHERFLLEVLLPLKKRLPFDYQPFSCSNMELSEPIHITPKAITIIEGSYACHPNLREHYDLRIFLTVSSDEQICRIRERNGEGLLKIFCETWIPLEEAYFESCQVMACCQEIFDTSSMPKN